MESWELLSPTTADENLLDVPEATLSKSQISLSLSLSLYGGPESSQHCNSTNTCKMKKHKQIKKTSASLWQHMRSICKKRTTMTTMQHIRKKRCK